MRTTPTAWLPVLSNIALPQLGVLSFLNQVEKIDNNPMLPGHNALSYEILAISQLMLKSRHPSLINSRKMTTFLMEELGRKQWIKQEVRNSNFMEPISKVKSVTVK